MNTNTLWRCNNHFSGEHDVFISYRVSSEAQVAKWLASLIERVGRRRCNKDIRVFLDSNCLNKGEDWEQGFLNGLRNSKLIIYLISAASLETLIEKTNANKVDNVLLEIETGLKMKAADQARLLPIFVGSIMADGSYSPFDTSYFSGSKYPDTIHAGSKNNVRDSMAHLFKIQGDFIKHPPSNKNALYLAADSILKLVAPHQITQANDQQLPPIAKSFMSHKTEIESIYQSLFIDGVSLVTGFPGMGKSSVAAKVAHDSLKLYQHVFWISLESIPTAYVGFERIAKSLNLSVSEPTSAAYRKVVSYWLECNHGYLLVIDNADSPKNVEECFQEVSKFLGDVLITSRHNNILQFFQHLNCHQIIQLESWSDVIACQYLEERTGIPTNISDSNVKSILHMLNGHALSVAQAGSFIKNKRLSYANFLKKMHNLVLDTSSFPEIGKRGSIAKIYQLFKDDIELSGITDPLRLLEAVSYLSPVSIPIELLEAFQEKLHLTTDAVENINILVDNGWLSTNADFTIFSTHSIIQELSRPQEQSASSVHCYITAFISLYLGNYTQMDSRGGEFYIELSKQTQSILTFMLQLNDHHQENWSLIKSLVNGWFAYLQHFGQQINSIEILYKCIQIEYQLYPHSNVLASSNFKLGEIKFEQGDYVEAKKLYEECLQIEEKVYGTRQHPSVASTIYALGQIAANQGDYAETKKLYEECLQIQVKVYGTRQHPSVASAIYALGQIASNQGDYAEAKKLYEECLQIHVKVYGTRQHLSVASTIHEIGIALSLQGHYAEAKKLYEECLQIQVKVYGTRQHPSVASAIYALGQIAANQGDYAEAKKLYEECLQIHVKVYGTRQHPSVSSTIRALGQIAANQGDYAEAKKLYEECLQIEEKVYGTRQHPSVASTIHEIGMALSLQGNYEEAKKLYEECLQIRVKVCGTRQHPSVSSTIRALGLMASKQGDYAEAKKLYEECLQIEEKVYGTRQHPSVAATIYALGKTASDKGDYAEAKKLYKECLKIQVNVYGTRQHPSVASAIYALGQIAANQGDYAEAKKLYAECLQIRVKVYGTRQHPTVASTIYAYDALNIEIKQNFFNGKASTKETKSCNIM
ncbi:TPR-like protein [Rhizoclosmatium globosum]|uniref:TPR-like protein n=1 Tax=Rhizoclosmatium globosum TaxID=329046 RepID=A0A1Y2ANN7_9FUNG|nr:TPR-like protein [Rhizoclosmatium globosum]|eukprot:ORY23910.1 TPR-like protein [Rhizoclosmatium globosum]